MKLNLLVVVMALPTWLLLGSATSAQERLTVERAGSLASYGSAVTKSIPLFPVDRSIGKVFQEVVAQPGTTALRLHFQVQSAPEARSWAIKVSDNNRNELWYYTSLTGIGSDFWSDELKTDRVIVEVYSLEKNSPLKLSIDRIAVSAPPITPTSITEPDQRASIDSQSAQVRNWGASVGRLRFIGDDDRQYYCTGFLVSSDLLLTNNHCIRSDREMRSGLVDFDYDSGAASSVTLRFSELIATDRELDFTLLRLAQPAGRGALQLDAAEPVNDQPLLVIQHPGGKPKEVSILDCRVSSAHISGVSGNLTDFGHLCDTLGGSSGSPVQDIGSGRVVGLHHLGFRPGNNRLVNQAVRVGLIVQFLRDRNSGVLQELGIQ